MTRYAADHKQATRRRMVDAAARRFKTDGFDGSGVATLVADAGLTNGAFYGHFASKDALIAEVVAAEMAIQAEQIEALPLGHDSLLAFVAAYLSPQHRDDRAGGCPSAALLDEVSRGDAATREAYTTGAGRIVDATVRHLTADQSVDREEAWSRAVGVLTLMVGAMQSARAVTDRVLSDRILAAAFSQVRILVAGDGR